MLLSILLPLLTYHILNLSKNSGLLLGLLNFLVDLFKRILDGWVDFIDFLVFQRLFLFGFRRPSEERNVASLPVNYHLLRDVVEVRLAAS